MKNNYLSKLQAAAMKGRQEGVLFGLDLCAVALNHVFGFGRERIERLEAEVQTLLDEVQTSRDMDRLTTDICRELARIRGEDEFFQRRYIKL